MKIELVNNTPSPELSIARAGGISHDNDIETIDEARDLIEKFIEWGHGSPLEFADATFKIEDISRSCLAQITRHRLASFMVRSMRYCREGEWPIIPDSWNEIDDDQLHLTMDNVIEGAVYAYDRMIEEGIPKEDARFILPIGSRTSLFMKANFREWRHIIRLRKEPDAQWEIRKLVTKILDELYEIAPSVFRDLE